MEKRAIIVTGIGGNVGQGVLRNIRSLNLDVRIIGLNILPFSAGNYLCDRTYVVPYAYDEGYISEIQQIVRLENVCLIIPTTDYEVYHLSLSQNEIDAKVVASSPEIAKIYLDKYLTYKHHSKLAIPFAKSWLPDEFNFEVKDIIVKPREGRGSRDIHINPSDPKAFSNEYVIQPLYRGVEITSAFYVKKDGTLHGLFTMQRELSNGATSKSSTVKTYDAQIKEIIDRMITVKGIAGSMNIQSIVSDNGDIVPFEVNCRISGTNSIRHNLGFQDVKYTLQEYLLNQEPDKADPIDGIAIRLLYDIIYPNALNESELNNNTSSHIVY